MTDTKGASDKLSGVEIGNGALHKTSIFKLQHLKINPWSGGIKGGRGLS